MKALNYVRKFLNSIKKLFEKNQVTETAVTSFSSLIVLPSRAELKKQAGQIEFLEDLKQEYIHQISNKKLLTSLEIEASRLRLEIDMYQELILNSMLKWAEEKISNKNTSLRLYRMLKFKVYICKLKELENETVLRLVALKEILEEKPFLMPYKKNSIKTTIENLSFSKIIISNNLLACEQEIERDLIEYGEISTATSEKENRLQEERLEELEKMLNSLSIKEMELQIENPSKAIEIVLKEFTLEIYVYQHKKEISILKEEASQLVKKMQQGKTLLQEYQHLEIKYNVFMQFGYNLITKEELIDFYTIKFHFLTQNIYEQSLEFLKEATPIELECYQEIISKKISDVLTGNKPWLKSNTYVSLGVNSVAKILKQNGKKFNSEAILNNKKMLSFLLAFDKEDGLIEFYKKSFEGKHLHEDFIDGYAYGCEWEDSLPLYTIYLVNYLSDNRNQKEILETFDEDVYYNLFKCIIGTHKIDGNLPKGIIKIHGEPQFMRKLKEHIRLIDVYVMPSSLEEYDYNMDNKSFWELRLNEGLKVIGKNSFRKCKITNLYIPSTLEHLEEGAFTDTSITNIYIHNYNYFKNSFLDIDYLIELLFRLEKTEKQKFVSFDSTSLEYHYSNYNGAINLCKNGTTYDIYRLIPKFGTLSIIENDKVILTLNKSDFNFTIEKPSGIFSNSQIRGTTCICSDNKKIRDYVCSLIEKRLSEIMLNYKQKIKR